MVVSNGFDRIRRPYSIIRELGMHISVGNKYGGPGIPSPNGRRKGTLLFRVKAVKYVFCVFIVWKAYGGN